MSSAILYLAIVAIWAFLLVPRWVRRPHMTSFAGAGNRGGEPELTSAEPGAGEPDAGGVDAGGADGRGADGRGADGRGADCGGADAPGDDRAAPGPGILWAVGREDEPEPDTAPLPPVVTPQPQAEPAPADAPSVPSASPASTSRPMVRARPPISRGKIVQARRRLLTTLVLLAMAAATCTALKLTSWWVCVPPAGMLGMYLLLLREAALADAENARWRAEQARAVRQPARGRSRVAPPASAAQPTAEVIDISARLGDQLYDQYADATVRAVGD